MTANTFFVLLHQLY